MKIKKFLNSQMSNVKCQTGQMAIVALIFLLFVAMITGTLFGRTAGFLRFGSNDIRTEQAVNLAEAGADYALWQLNKTGGTYSTTSSGDTINMSNGQFTVVVTNTSSQIKTITSTGYIPSKANPRRKETIKLTGAVNTSQIAFHYAVETGSGGFTMSGASTLVSGNLYAGCTSPCTQANITGSGGATIDGDAYATGTITPETDLHLTAGHNRYPTQTTNLPTMPTLPAAPQPYATWQAAAASGGTVTCPCTLSTNVNIGPKQYNGDVTISGGAIVSVTGPIYITGALNIGGSSHLQLDTNTFQSTDTVVLVDGAINIGGGATVDPTTATPKGYILLATNSAGTGAPYALDIGGGTQSGIFYSLNGTTNISNAGTRVTALVAKGANMSAGTLNYDIGFGNSTFSSGPGGSWQVQKGSYIYTPSP